MRAIVPMLLVALVTVIPTVSSASYTIMATSKTWIEAYNICKDLGKKLAHIGDTEDVNELVALAGNAGVQKIWTAGQVKRSCVSGVDRSDSCFEWIGTDVPFVGRWRNGEPSSPGGSIACVRMHPTSKWSTQSCSHRHAFACEDIPETTTEASITALHRVLSTGGAPAIATTQAEPTTISATTPQPPTTAVVVTPTMQQVEPRPTAVDITTIAEARTAPTSTAAAISSTNAAASTTAEATPTTTAAVTPAPTSTVAAIPSTTARAILSTAKPTSTMIAEPTTAAKTSVADEGPAATAAVPPTTEVEPLRVANPPSQPSPVSPRGPSEPPLVLSIGDRNDDVEGTEQNTDSPSPPAVVSDGSSRDSDEGVEQEQDTDRIVGVSDEVGSHGTEISSSQEMAVQTVTAAPTGTVNPVPEMEPQRSEASSDSGKLPLRHAKKKGTPGKKSKAHSKSSKKSKAKSKKVKSKSKKGKKKKTGALLATPTSAKSRLRSEWSSYNAAGIGAGAIVFAVGIALGIMSRKKLTKNQSENMVLREHYATPNYGTSNL